jgi:four helix bundle protein
MVYKITEGFPYHELYGLTSQMRRSSVSIPSNVAERFRRRHSKEFKNFLILHRVHWQNWKPKL